MAGRGAGPAVGACAIVALLATGAGAGADEHAALPRLHGMGSARFVTRTATEKNGKPVVLVSRGEVDFRRKVAQETTTPRGVYAAESRTLGPDSYWRGSPGEKLPRGIHWFHARHDFVPDLSVQDAADTIRGTLAFRPHVERRGPAKVHGVPTTHYRLTSSVPVAPKLRAAGLTGFAGHTDAWVDRDGHVRRFRTETTASGGLPGSVHVTDYFDLGTDVAVERPPADEVDDISGSSARMRVTGPAVVIGAGVADGIPWTARLIPTRTRVCRNLSSDGRPQPYGARIRGTRFLGVACAPPDDAVAPTLELDLLRNGAQVVHGPVPDGTTTVTVRADDGTTEELAPRNGGIAFAIVGDRIATELVLHAPDGTRTCTLDAPGHTYRCVGPNVTIPAPSAAPIVPTTDPNFRMP